MINRIYILWLAVLIGIQGSQLIGQNNDFDMNPEQNRPHDFKLLSPQKNVTIVQGPLKFTWENNGDPDPPDFRVNYYEVTFWSENQKFNETFKVIPDDSVNEVIRGLEIKDYRKVFRRHGRYYWKVTAFDAGGNQTSSEVWNFIINIPEIEEEFTPWAYIYAIQFQYNHRLHTDEYLAFLKNVNPNMHMRSYSELNFVFRQEKLLIPFIEMEEKISLLSQVGIGGEISSHIRMLQNLYFSLCPYASIATGWYSTGLRDYANTFIAAHLGCDMFMMPRGYISLHVSWLPTYHVRYIEKGEYLRTFLGEGWEYGVRFIISNAVIKMFRFLGMEIDFQRIPLEFHFSQIRDQYSGTLLRMRRMSIGYLLQ